MNVPERRDHPADDITNGVDPHPSVEPSDRQTGALDLRLEHERRALHIHAVVFAGSMLIIILVNAALNAAAGIVAQWWAWWSVLALVGWGLGLSVHGAVVRLSRR